MARVETGVVKFGDDWPGVFIRGDNAMMFAMALRQIDLGPPSTHAQMVAALGTLLESCNVVNDPVPQKPLDDARSELTATKRELAEAVARIKSLRRSDVESPCWCRAYPEHDHDDRCRIVYAFLAHRGKLTPKPVLGSVTKKPEEGS